MFYTYYDSPLGKMILKSDDVKLSRLAFSSHLEIDEHDELKDDLNIFHQTKTWLDIYFKGQIPNFTPKYSLECSEFRKEIFSILLTIPYGKTTSYKEVAQIYIKKKGIPNMSAQAIGGAIKKNPLLLIIPCHRVIGLKGNLIGYIAGIDIKAKLLELEKSNKETI